MPNSLNRIFRHFREKQKQRKNNEFNNENYQINFNLNKTSGLSGCCSRKTSSSIPSDTIQKKNSWTIGRKNSDQLSQINFEQIFSDVILFRIFDAIENPFELIRLKRVCKKAAEYVRNRISNIIELDVRRVKFETLSASSLSSSCSISNNSTDSITSTIIEGELWHTHPNGCKVLGRISNYLNKNKKEENKENEEDEENKFTKEEKIKNEQKFKLEILVDEQWTSREISVLCSLLNEFRFNLNQISLDAPIFELIVARLASIDLERWFAYQCFVKAIDECQMNAALNKLAAQLQQQQQDDPFDKSDNLYWPNAKTIVIRTTENESIHLARVLNYGVRSNLVMDKRQLNCFSLQVCLKDSKRAATLGIAAQRPKQLVRNLYHFRCWAGSPGFDERFSQHWKASSRAA